jgi:hypothetical protein
MVDTGHRSENVALDAVSCATVPSSSEGGPAKWLKNKNLEIIFATANQEAGSSNLSGRTKIFRV